jgi:hypothetical protein
MSRGVKKGSKIKFYTQKEIQIMERVMKNGDNHKENVEILSKQLNRSITGVSVKYRELRRESGDVRKINRNETVTKTVELPENTILNFPAKSVVVENNRIIVYFK